MPKINELSVNESLLLKALKQRSSENPLTRSEIKDITKLRDNNNRLLLGSLRDKGYRVISGKKGYWVARSENEYKTWVEGYKQHAVKVLQRIAAMDNKVEGQVTM